MSDEPQQPLDIRRFEAGDGDRVREVHERAMAETPEYLPEVPDEDLDAIEAQYLTASGDFLVGLAGRTIVAIGAYTTPDEWKAEYLDVDESTAELTRMRVHPDWQGGGYGSAMYRELRERALDGGYRRLVLDTGAENDRARGFYERLGFDRRCEITVGSGDLSVDLVLYQRRIDR